MQNDMRLEERPEGGATVTYTGFGSINGGDPFKRIEIKIHCHDKAGATEVMNALDSAMSGVEVSAK